MSGRIENLYSRGKTAASGELTDLYGQKCEFPDVNWSSTQRVKPFNSMHTVTCIWVMNNSGGALSPRQVCVWKAGYFGTRVGDVADTGDIPAGVVDEHVSTVADGAGFYLVVHGPTELITDGNGALAQGNVLITIGTSTGRVRIQTAAPADATAAMIQVNTRVGICTETVAATAGLTFRAFVDTLRNL